MITKEQLIEDIKSIDDFQSLEQVHQLIEQIKQQKPKKPTLMSQLRSIEKINIPNENAVKKHTRAEQEKAMAEFFGMHKELGIENVEEELRLIRKGRRSRLMNIYNEDK